jgi:uncharacterized membrane protein YoaK (UPF0700 family)
LIAIHPSQTSEIIILSHREFQPLPDPLPETPRIVAAIALLAMSSGLLDAVVYTQHGQVFANAMTGNLVLLGVLFLSPDRREIVRHLVPLAGFTAGVVFGKYLLRRHRSVSVVVALLLQTTVLCVAGFFARRVPSYGLVAVLSITGAVIITVIRKTGDVAFNITFMTGNLRAVIEGAFDALFPPPAPAPPSPGVRQFLIVGITCSGFLLGAVVGALSAQLIHERSFWISALLLVAAGSLLRQVNTAADL